MIMRIEYQNCEDFLHVHTRLQYNKIAAMLLGKIFTCYKIRCDIFSDCSVWTTTCLHSLDSRNTERSSGKQKLIKDKRMNIKFIKLCAYIYLLASSASCLVKNSPSSRVNMSLVTAHRLYFSRNLLHSCNIRAVLPLPTGPPIG